MGGMQVKHSSKGNLQFSLLILEKNSLKINHLTFQLKKIKMKCKPNSKYKERKKIKILAKINDIDRKHQMIQTEITKSVTK